MMHTDHLSRHAMRLVIVTTRARTIGTMTTAVLKCVCSSLTIAAISVVSTGVRVPLTLTSQATGLDPDVTRAALDAFVRERGETKTVPGRRALDEETRAAVARDAERRV